MFKKILENIFAVIVGVLIYKNVLSPYSEDKQPPPTTGGLFVYKGEITRQSVDLIINKIKTDAIKVLEITSEGGEVEEGFRLAKFVYDNDISIVVSNYCNSSCTFTFFSSKNRVMYEDATLSLHNMSVTIDSDSNPKARMTLQEAVDMSNKVARVSATIIAFYASVGIPSKDLTRIATLQGKSALTYSKNDMKRLGFIK